MIMEQIVLFYKKVAEKRSSNVTLLEKKIQSNKEVAYEAAIKNFTSTQI